jgi:hypothetical protein
MTVEVVGTHMSEEVVATSFEACLEALADVERRRLLLALLDGTSDGVALDQLDPDAEDETLELSMHHVHLPKLEASGFIDTDRQQRSVSRGPRFDEVRPLLELLDDNRGQLPDGWV